MSLPPSEWPTRETKQRLAPLQYPWSSSNLIVIISLLRYIINLLCILRFNEELFFSSVIVVPTDFL